MHEHLEIILPKVDNYVSAVEEIMKPFSENDEDASHAFWDWYVIGGRFSGEKLQHRLGQDKIDAFTEELNNLKITVSGVQCGKQEISPSDQIVTVDSLWRDHFPDSGISVCPLFKHSNKDSSTIHYDVCTFSDVPLDLPMSKIIVAGLNYNKDGYTAEAMFSQSLWNGVCHENTEWDGLFSTALALYDEKIKNCKPEYYDKHTPKDDWLVITVDYHS